MHTTTSLYDGGKTTLPFEKITHTLFHLGAFHHDRHHHRQHHHSPPICLECVYMCACVWIIWFRGHNGKNIGKSISRVTNYSTTFSLSLWCPRVLHTQTKLKVMRGTYFFFCFFKSLLYRSTTPRSSSDHSGMRLWTLKEVWYGARDTAFVRQRGMQKIFVTPIS